jgi:hypothetical protein
VAVAWLATRALGLQALRRDAWAVPDQEGGLLGIDVLAVPAPHRVPGRDPPGR